MSQRTLASVLGVTRVYISQVENDRRQPSIAFLRLASSKFGVPLSLLVAWEDTTETENEIHRELLALFGDLLDAKTNIGNGENGEKTGDQ